MNTNSGEEPRVFSQILRQKRNSLGWSQAKLAEEVGVDARTISRWEQEESFPLQSYTRNKLCSIFNVTPEELGLDSKIPEKTPEVPPLPLKPRNPYKGLRAFRSEDAGDFFGRDQLTNDPESTSPLSGNPFIYGNPISDPKHFFGRKDEVERVFDRLCNPGFGSSSLVGERRIGKTSVLKHLAHPVARNPYGLNSDKHLFVYVNLQIVGRQTTPEELWHWLLRQIASCCSNQLVKQLLEKPLQTQPPNKYAFQLKDVFESIDAAGYYVVLLLDEFEHVTGNENFKADFFDVLRVLATEHHLALITSSRRKLYEICYSKEISSSRLFNIFAHINLGLFTREEAKKLIKQSLMGTGTKFTDKEHEKIFRLAGDHPYFLQVACWFLFNAYAKYPNSDPISEEKRANFLKEAFREETGPHLAFYWHNSDDQEKLTLTILTVLERAHGISSLSVSRDKLREKLHARFSRTLSDLIERSLVTTTPTKEYALFNTSFGKWIWNELTDTRHNQQRYKEWLTSDEWVTGHLKNLPDTTKGELDKILPQMNDMYWRLLCRWLTEPEMLDTGSELIKGLSLLRGLRG